MGCESNAKVSLAPSGARSSSNTSWPTVKMGFGNLPAVKDAIPGRMPKLWPGVKVRNAQSRLKCLRVKSPVSVSLVETGLFGSPEAPRMVAESSSLNATITPRRARTRSRFRAVTSAPFCRGWWYEPSWRKRTSPKMVVRLSQSGSSIAFFASAVATFVSSAVCSTCFFVAWPIAFCWSSWWRSSWTSSWVLRSVSSSSRSRFSVGLSASPETATGSSTATIAPTSPRFMLAPVTFGFPALWLKSARQSRGRRGAGASLLRRQCRRRPRGVAQPVLRLVVLGDRRDVVVPRAGQVFFGLDVLQHVADAELLPLPCEPQTLTGRGELPLHRRQLVGERPDSRIGLDDLARDLVLQLLLRHLGTVQPRFCCMNAAEVEQPAGPDPPAEARKVVLRVAEMVGVVVHTAAQSTGEHLCAHR